MYVAIADVSHYVKPGTALDKEAFNRGNSVYFPNRVVPMLPEVLSNGLCSLNPKVERLCMVCEMTISEQGKLTGYKFYEGLMCSKARLTYTEVGAFLDEPESEAAGNFLTHHGELAGTSLNSTPSIRLCDPHVMRAAPSTLIPLKPESFSTTSARSSRSCPSFGMMRIN